METLIMAAAITGPLVGALAFVRTLNRDSKGTEARITTVETQIGNLTVTVDKVDAKVDKIYDHLLRQGESHGR